jgi:hypothetical protein
MEDTGIFYLYLVHFLAILGIFCGHLVYFSPFWFIVLRKIWQPCCKAFNLRETLFGFSKHVCASWRHGCQIFLGPKYQKGEKYTKLPQNIPNGYNIFPMAVK